MVAEARQRWALEGVIVIHRVGELRPGDQIVLVAMSGWRPTTRTAWQRYVGKRPFTMAIDEGIAGVMLAGGRSSRMTEISVSSGDANAQLKPHRILAGQRQGSCLPAPFM